MEETKEEISSFPEDSSEFDQKGSNKQESSSSDGRKKDLDLYASDGVDLTYVQRKRGNFEGEYLQYSKSSQQSSSEEKIKTPIGTPIS